MSKYSALKDKLNGKKPKTNEISVSSSSIMGTQILDFNPEDLRITSMQGLTVYDKIKDDPLVASCEELIRRQCLTIDYHIDSSLTEEQERKAEYKNLDEEIRDFINFCFENFQYETFLNSINNLLDARIYGIKIAEMLWELDKDKYRLSAIKCKKK